MECSINLINLYMSGGLYDKMMREYRSVMSTTYAERTMMNHYSLQACGVPGMAVSVLAFSDEVQRASAAYRPGAVKLMHALALSLDTPLCRTHDKGLYERSLQSVLRTLSANGDAPRPGLSLASLCADEELQRYLLTEEIVQHPCEAFSQRRAIEASCAAFNTDLAPPHDIRQIQQLGEFVGAASLLDIVHHAYAGDSGRVFGRAPGPGGVYRVLFGQFFNAKNVYTFLKQLIEHPQGDKVEIYVLSPSQQMKNDVERHIEFCLKDHPGYKARAAMSGDHGVIHLDSLGEAGEAGVKYDYIEYNGGMSRGSTYKSDIAYLRDRLVSDGVIGVTAFSHNKHVREIQRLVEQRNQSAHKPFSSEPFRLARDYLSAVGLTARAKKDVDLIYFLGSDSDSERPRRTYTKGSLVKDLADSGLEVVSFLSSALAAPYAELGDQHSVQKWRSLGVSEADFVEDFLAPFRHVVYASRSGAGLPGRPSLLRDSFPGDTIFADRSQGSLAEAFSGVQGAGALEKLRVPLLVQFRLNWDAAAPAKAEDDKMVSVYLAADAVAGLSLLPASPALAEMVEHNVALRPSTAGHRPSLPPLLLKHMVTLEKLGLISVYKPYSDGKSLPAAGAAAGVGAEAGHTAQNLVTKLREHEANRQEKKSAMRALGFSQGTIDAALAAEDAEFRRALAGAPAAPAATPPHAADAGREEASPPSPSANTRGIKQVNKKSKAVKGGGAAAASTAASAAATAFPPPPAPAAPVPPPTKEESPARARLLSSRGPHAPGARVTTSLSKLEFDLNQLRYIVFEHAGAASSTLSDLVAAYQQVIDSVRARAEPGAAPTAPVLLTAGRVNSVTHLAQEAVRKGASACQPAALEKLPGLVKSLGDRGGGGGYASLDGLLESRPLRALSGLLLGSSVWLLAGNGRAFLAHSDDGLVFDLARQLAEVC
jgi:hypothetical protein